MPELQLDPARLRSALNEAEADLAALQKVIAERYEVIDEDERRAVRIEQMIAALRSRLAGMRATGVGEDGHA